MNHDLLKTIIFDQHEVIKNQSIIERDYTFDLSMNYILVGLRRAGKSTILYDIVQKMITKGIDWHQIIYINFEDERLYEFKTSDFNDILLVKNELTEKKGYYFFDEIQNIEGWEKFARRMADQKDFVYITGSNAKMLSKDISTTLGGRYIPKYISPYTFKEFLLAQNIKIDTTSLLKTSTKGTIIGKFDDYNQFGGFPESVNLKIKREYLSNVYQKVLLGDVVARNGIRNDIGISLLVKKIAESVKSDISYTKLHNTLKSIGISISKDTLISYISYLQDAYLIFSIHNLYASFVDKESNPKYYFNDNGLLNLFLFDKSSSLLENVVGIFLHNKYQENLYYLKSAKTKIDIDFYVLSENIAIQVAYSIQDMDTRKREINNLIRYSETNPDAKLILLTYNEKEEIIFDNTKIEVCPIYEFFTK